MLFITISAGKKLILSTLIYAQKSLSVNIIAFGDDSFGDFISNETGIMLITTLRILLTISGVIVAAECLWLMRSGKVNFGTLLPSLIAIVFIVHGLF